MDPKCSAQDVVRCHLCETPLPPLHCDTCHLDLCKACVGEHLLDDSRQHKMVPFKQRGTTPIYPNCPNHDKKQCEFYCKECIVPVCSSCILTNSHKGHTLLPSLDVIEAKLKAVEKDVDELQNSIYPKYEEILLELEKKKADLEIYYGKLTTNATQMGEDFHKEINILVNKSKTEINEMKTKHLAVLNQQEDKIANSVSEITKSIANLKKLLVSKDVCLVSENNSKNAQFRKLPPKLIVSLPKFTSLEIKRDQLTEQFGSLSEISFTEEERGNIMPTQEVQPSPPNSWRDREREKEEEGGCDWRAWRPAGAREGGGWREREKQRSESWKKETSPTKQYEEEKELKGEGWRGERGAPREDRPPVRGIYTPRETWRSRGEDRVPSRDGGDRGGFGERRRDDRDFGRGRDDRDFGRGRDDRDRDFGDAWRDRRKDEGGDERGGGAWRGGRTGGDSWRERTGEKEGWSRRDDRGPAREDRVSARWGFSQNSEVPPSRRERERRWRDKHS
ncbi:eukaryotic translation initiation factor 3 subunit A-like [Crassostrea angulata]|uniref:eukaryotic translation initiation factor 3 subunit A-like n=1 Tax=Magallana angulata TaxID=2784310 RepID=UPI0022B10B5E|nr:eukaryotic translation initiation factor 3 subunit A-like [Crassostrea angulata]